jgi:hypothetical protein
LIAHTKPAPNIPSKNTAKILLSPIISTFGEKYAKDKKNPTHVDVHNIHLINEDTNEKNGVNTFNPCPGCAFLCIRFLNPLKIDP